MPIAATHTGEVTSLPSIFPCAVHAPPIHRFPAPMPATDHRPALGKQLKRSFFARSVHEIAPELIGATLLVNGVGGTIVEVEAYHQT